MAPNSLQQRLQCRQLLRAASCLRLCLPWRGRTHFLKSDRLSCEPLEPRASSTRPDPSVCLTAPAALGVCSVGLAVEGSQHPFFSSRRQDFQSILLKLNLSLGARRLQSFSPHPSALRSHPVLYKFPVGKRQAEQHELGSAMCLGKSQYDMSGQYLPKHVDQESCRLWIPKTCALPNTFIKFPEFK